MQVADNGTPPLSATQSFQVTVQTPARPVVFAPTVSGGMLSLLVNGDSGPDYTLQGTTNLNPTVNWLPLQTNLAATPPFTFTNALTHSPSFFYRVKLGP